MIEIPPAEKKSDNHAPESNRAIADFYDTIAPGRDDYIKKNSYYYDDLLSFLSWNIPPGSSVLEIGCGNGYILDKLAPGRGAGIDISPRMIGIARSKYPRLDFRVMDAENITLDEKFDFVVLSDTLGCFRDIQKVFNEIGKIAKPSTRVIITYHNFLWSPFLKLGEILKFKMPQKRLNWLNDSDIKNLLYVEDYDIVKEGRRFLLPKKIPLLSDFLNKYPAKLPVLNRLCLTGYIIARPAPRAQKDLSVSVVIPARNEKGNIENAVKRMPKLGRHTEIIFVEGHSQDGTLDEIRRVREKFKAEHDLKYFVQDGKGKGDAVRKGFAEASGDILMILDADLTVPPEDLIRFYEAIASGKGEYINGTRLVYPMEREAMRTLNMIGNKFFSLMFSWLLGQRIKDTLCGTKVIAKENYEKLKANRRYFGDFDPFGDFDLIFGSAKLNLKFIEIPIKYRARAYGETNISRFSHGWLLLKMMFFAFNKIKFI